MAKDFSLAARRKSAGILGVFQALTTKLPAEKTSQISQVISKQFLIAAALIGSRETNTLVLVHTQALLNQWKDSLTEYLEIHEALPELPKKRGRKKGRPVIGQLCGSKNILPGIKAAFPKPFRS